MNRSNDLYQKVTDEIIAALEKGVIPLGSSVARGGTGGADECPVRAVLSRHEYSPALEQRRRTGI